MVDQPPSDVPKRRKTEQPEVSNEKDKGGLDQSGDLFALEQIFPAPLEMLKPCTEVTADSSAVAVVLDTNALLLPYEIGAGNLRALRTVFESLVKQKRLLVPGRALREFVQHHSRKLAEVMHALSERKNLAMPKGELPHLLDENQTAKEMAAAYKKLLEARGSYAKAVDKMISDIAGWRENDPVAEMYAEIFDGGTVIDLVLDEVSRGALSAEWRWRLRNRIHLVTKMHPKTIP